MSVADLAQLYEIDTSVELPEPTEIALVDDVLTAGTHFKAAQAVLHARYLAAKSSGCFGPVASSRTRSRISTTPDPDKLRTSCHPGIQATPRTLPSVLAPRPHDPGQSRRIANFILAWWNADDLGGFGLADIFAVDQAIGQDMASVFPGSPADRSPSTRVPIVPRSGRSSASGDRRSGCALRRRHEPVRDNNVAAWLERRGRSRRDP
ncbi:MULTISPECIES: hypothetical protein [unclassified Bosea (in: a-proteobacteria)]|uniref:DUF7673 family protein n=1 Tax=unclassified Bosea (in: a-proteobacteria) TaxID=2653178 RepID=UPI003003C2B1